MNEPREPSLGERVNSTANIVLWISAAFAFPAIVFLHRDIGRRFAGMQAFLSIVLMFFWPLVAPQYDPRPMFVFLGAVLVMSCFSRMQGLRRKAAGDPIHRYYTGYPRLMAWMPCQSELQFKRFQEPVLTFFAGCIAAGWSPLVMLFIWASSVGLAVSALAIEFAESERVDAIRDQMIVQRVIAERVRRF